MMIKWMIYYDTLRTHGSWCCVFPVKSSHFDFIRMFFFFVVGMSELGWGHSCRKLNQVMPHRQSGRPSGALSMRQQQIYDSEKS